MKLFFIFMFCTFYALNHVKSFELDFTQTEPPKTQVIVSEYKDPAKTNVVVAKFFNSNSEDAFSSVKEGNVVIWDGKATHKCEFAKVFYEETNPVALKLGIQKKDPSNHIRNIEGFFYLKDRSVWKKVLKTEYLKFLKEKGFKNMAWVSHETDEKFQKQLRFRDVQEPLDPSEAAKDESDKSKKEVEKRIPVPGRPGSLEEPEEKQLRTEEERRRPELPGKRDVPPEGETDEEKRKRLGHLTIQQNSNVIPENEKETSSFLTNSLILPATILLFYVSY